MDTFSGMLSVNSSCTGSKPLEAAILADFLNVPSLGSHLGRQKSSALYLNQSNCTLCYDSTQQSVAFCGNYLHPDEVISSHSLYQFLIFRTHSPSQRSVGGLIE